MDFFFIDFYFLKTALKNYLTWTLGFLVLLKMCLRQVPLTHLTLLPTLNQSLFMIKNREIKIKKKEGNKKNRKRTPLNKLLKQSQVPVKCSGDKRHTKDPL